MAPLLIVEDEPITAADQGLKLAAVGHQVAALFCNGEELAEPFRFERLLQLLNERTRAGRSEARVSA